MSHIIGIIGKNVEKYNKTASAIMQKPFFVCNDNNALILIENTNKNVCLSSSNNRIIGISGTPIVTNNNEYKLLSNEILDGYDCISHDEINRLNGHFCGFDYTPNLKIRLFNDLFAYKSLYYCLKDAELIFSSSLDYLARLSNNRELDMSNCGSLWLLQNNYSLNSPIKNISKLKPGEILEFDFNVLKSKRKEFYPSIDEMIKDEEVLEQLVKMLRIETDNSTKSIALSGGLDSRFLLALLISSDTKFKAFCLGNIEHPDNRIAKQICTDFAIEFENFNPNYQFDLNSIKKFASSTFLTFPISEYLQKKSYQNVFESVDIVFDGGIAEIARRGFFNNILLRFKKDINPANSKDLYKYFKYYHSDIFKNEINELLEQNAISDIEVQLNSLPEDLSPEHKLDLLALRVKLPNYAGIEQARLDEYGINITPFVQQDFLKLIFKVEVDQKKNAKIFKSTISKFAPNLKNYPLVKGDLSIPYSLPTIAGKILGKTKKKLNLSFDDSSKHLFVSKMKEYTYDTINSAWAKSDNMLDISKAQKIADDYYSRKTKSFWEMDWLITYLIYKESINI